MSRKPMDAWFVARESASIWCSPSSPSKSRMANRVSVMSPLRH
ncbi:MAG: hypothetical protein SA339_01885 [Methanomassiliicoccus sp.]|nr:hypothetical protein [Methanomassiliicoccus sp.]